MADLVIGEIELMYSIDNNLAVLLLIRMTLAQTAVHCFDVKHDANIPCHSKLQHLRQCRNSLTTVQLSCRI